MMQKSHLNSSNLVALFKDSQDWEFFSNGLCLIFSLLVATDECVGMAYFCFQ